MIGADAIGKGSELHFERVLETSGWYGPINNFAQYTM